MKSRDAGCSFCMRDARALTFSVFVPCSPTACALQTGPRLPRGLKRLNISCGTTFIERLVNLDLPEGLEELRVDFTNGMRFDLARLRGLLHDLKVLVLTRNYCKPRSLAF